MINIQVHAHWFIIKIKQNKAKQQQKQQMEVIFIQL